ncbi:hypothetical protein FQA39_LY13836 [Lamprigera yunnana]|nr:hypothetical protein FQA39_LY13836 [Lamprigera yunnana]
MRIRKVCVYVFVIVTSVFLFFYITQNKRWVVSNKCPKLLSVIHGGNLGNQIFEYMSLYAYAKLFKDADILPYCPNRLKRNLERVFEKLFLPTLYPTVPKECNDINKFFKVPLSHRMTLNEVKGINKSIMLNIYSSKVDEILELGMNEITKEMRFKKKNVQYCNELFHQLKASYNWTNENVTFVGMHYRGTDYSEHLNKTYRNYRTPPDHKYYSKAMSYFSKMYPKVIFILITVDYGWAKNNYPSIKDNQKIVLNPNKGNVVEDFTTLAHCNHSILSYGTFGTAAALFNRGTTFVYNLNIPTDYRGSTAPPDHKYYSKAMSYFSKMYPKVIFILITVDYGWAKNNYPSIKDNQKVVLNPNKGNVVEDFTTLAHCNHSILSYGTFGTAAALFNRGTTFVYNLNIPTDYRGSTVSMILASLLSNWFLG